LKERPDLIILDLLLPGIPEIQVANRLREAGVFPAIPFIVSTALDEGEATAIAESLRATSELNKTFGIKAILDWANWL